MTKALDIYRTTDIATEGTGIEEIERRIAALKKFSPTGKPHADAYLEIAMIALACAASETEDETARQEYIDSAAHDAEIALDTEPE